MSLKSVVSHENKCNKNDKRIYTKFNDPLFQINKCGNGGENQYTKAKRLGLDVPIVSIETRLKMSNSASGKKQLKKTKEKLSEIAKQNCLGGHTSKKSMYYKKKDGTILYLHSSYEVKFAELLDELNIDWERPPPFKWIDLKGISHRYYPDFKIGNKYFDTKKEYLAVKDAPKIKMVAEQNNINLQIVRIHQITKDFIISQCPIS